MQYNMTVTTENGICSHCGIESDSIIYKTTTTSLCVDCILLPQYDDYVQDMFKRHILHLSNPRLIKPN